MDKILFQHFGSNCLILKIKKNFVFNIAYFEMETNSITKLIKRTYLAIVGKPNKNLYK